MQGIAVGRGTCRGSRADIAARAWTVFDQDRLAPCVAELLRDDARQRVERAASGKCDNYAHGSIGIALRNRARLQYECAGGDQDRAS